MQHNTTSYAWQAYFMALQEAYFLHCAKDLLLVPCSSKLLNTILLNVIWCTLAALLTAEHMPTSVCHTNHKGGSFISADELHAKKA